MAVVSPSSWSTARATRLLGQDRFLGPGVRVLVRSMIEDVHPTDFSNPPPFPTRQL
jgi:hypothetical protein